MQYAKGAMSMGLCALLSGCVAVWGAAHHVENADANGIKVKYDPGLTTSVRAQVVAREHCQSFGKDSEAVSAETSPLSGIAEEVYRCIPKKGAN